jgi:predicted transcriptional regulator
MTEQKPTIKISEKLKQRLDKLAKTRRETYESIIERLLWYKKRNKILEKILNRQDDEINELQEEVAKLQKEKEE